jgi:hypothetical protein
MVGVDFGGWVVAAAIWIADHFLFEVLVEALGLSAIITIAVARFTAKLSDWSSRLQFGGLAFLACLIAINSFGTKSAVPNVNFRLLDIATSPATTPQGEQQGTNVFVGVAIEAHLSQRLLPMKAVLK